MIVGLDIATRCTGWAIGRGDCRPAVDAWRYEDVGDDLGLLLERYDADLTWLAATHGMPTVITYEAPILVSHDKLLTLRKIYSMGAYTELWGRKRGICVEEASSIALKKALTGSHKAKKPDMVAMARKLGIKLPPGKVAEDAADAFASWLIGVSNYAREHQPRWDRALYSERGRLDL